MSKDLGNYRKSYLKGVLNEKDLPPDPLELLNSWFSNVDSKKSEIEPNAMSLSTISLDGYPKTRVVLLKKITKSGLIFFTNYNSVKGVSINKNSKVCLSFFWSSLEQQIIVIGDAKKISTKESTDYFNSRPIGSKIGAIVSEQSKIIPSRNFLLNKYEKLSNRKNDFQRPDDWGGYIVEPISYEFWQGRDNRLHDRILYEREGKSWNYKRLSP
tara:strand:+ start:2916 stop:3554 length:639 start_codon:yes stop_codon:yes gene_type:complete